MLLCLRCGYKAAAAIATAPHPQAAATAAYLRADEIELRLSFAVPVCRPFRRV